MTGPSRVCVCYSRERLLSVVCVSQGRVETDVEEVNTELQRHRDTLALLSKQMKLLRHVPLEVASLRDDLLNVIAQLPPGSHQSTTRPT